MRDPEGLAKPNAFCNSAKPKRRCGSPALTATTKVRQQTGQEGPNPLRGFWDRPAKH
jgi:hypothetical protein